MTTTAQQVEDKAPQRRMGFLLSIVSLVSGAILTLVLTPLYVRILGPSEFGVYGLALSVAAATQMLPNATASVYLHFHWRARRSGGLRAVVGLNTLLLLSSLVGMAGAIVVAGWFLVSDAALFTSGLTGPESDLARCLMAVLAVNVGLTFVFAVFEAILLADESFIMLRMIGLGRQILGPSLFIPALLTVGSSQSLVWITLIVNLLMGAVGVVVVLRRPVRTFGRIGEAFALLGPIARFGGYILAGAVVYQVNWSVDRIIVAHFHGAAEVGVLTVALQITTMFMLFGIMLSNVFTPLVNEYASDPRQAEKIHVLFLRIGRYEATVLGLFLAVFLVVGKDFIHFWLGPGYQGAFYATAIFMIGGIWAFVQSLGPEIQKAKNLQRFRTVVLLLSSAFKILLSFLLVGRWGVVGAAVSTAVTLVLFDGAAMNWYYSRRLGLPVGRFWRQLLPVIGVVVGSIVVGGLPGLAFGPEPSLLGIGAQALVAGLAFGVGCWFVVLTSEEKARISGMLRR